MTARLNPFARLTAAAAALAIALAAPLPALAGPHILVELKSGKVIDHQDAFQRWYPASLTKLMTVYTAFKALKAGKVTLQTPIVMSKKSAGQPASKMYLKPGDWMTLEDALKLVLVKSANDVAYAVAENLGGSLEAYVAEMNRDALSIGMNSSRFINANGLPGKGQYTTARDMALLAMALRRDFPEYAHFFALEGVNTGKKVYPNYNMLIGRFDGADGMKTGFICASGFNQVTTATRNGKTVVSVVLGTESLAARADLSADLLQKGFEGGTFGAPSIKGLQPYGPTRNQVADVSKDICSKAGKKVRSESRDEAGRQKLLSPYIHEMVGEPDAALVTIWPGKKTKPGQPDMAALEQGDEADLSNIPIPVPRPLN